MDCTILAPPMPLASIWWARYVALMRWLSRSMGIILFIAWWSLGQPLIMVPDDDMITWLAFPNCAGHTRGLDSLVSCKYSSEFSLSSVSELSSLLPSFKWLRYELLGSLVPTLWVCDAWSPQARHGQSRTRVVPMWNHRVYNDIAEHGCVRGLILVSPSWIGIIHWPQVWSSLASSGVPVELASRPHHNNIVNPSGAGNNFVAKHWPCEIPGLKDWKVPTQVPNLV